MARLPDYMLRRNRPLDQDFEPEEELFRAFGADDLEGDRVAIDAIELPDMSVNREKYGPPESLLYLDMWVGHGVAGFKVKDIPPEMLHRGTRRFTFQVVHDPTENNYPHSVIQAFEGGTHIQLPTDLDPELHLRWRRLMQMRMKVRIQPGYEPQWPE
jgi:hypothetical protein